MANSYWDTLKEQNDAFGGYGYELTNEALNGLNGLKAPDTGSSFLGMNKGQWGMASQGVNAVTGLASLYAGMQGLDLARDQLNFNKDQANKQYAMAKDAYDRNVARADSIAAQMRAGSANLKAVG